MTKYRLVFAAVAAVALSSFASAQPAALSPSQPYTGATSDPVTYDVDLRAVVTAPYNTKVLKVWMPVPPSDAAQQVSESRFSHFPAGVEPKVAAEPVFGNTFAYFEIHKPQGAQIIQHTFRVKAHELRWNLDPAKVDAVKAWPAAFEPYLRGEGQSVVVDDRFEKLAAQIVPRRRNAAVDLAGVLAWVDANMTYDHVKASLAGSAVHALEQRRGHCSDYHGLCSSLGRALGYPTRITYGINPFAKASPSHCKMEAFIPPYGWVSFDSSETQKLIGDIAKASSLSSERREALAAAARRRLVEGFRDNTWFLQTRGSDYELAPPAAKKAAVVRTIYAEADGAALPEPDPANIEQKAYTWMTAHQYKADRAVTYPFKDAASLEAWVK